MHISLDNLSPKVRRFIQSELAKGIYKSPEEMVEIILVREAEKKSSAACIDSTEDEAIRIKQFLDHLQKIGFLREVRSLGDAPAFDDFEPIPIDGPPLSQTIIEDRR